MARKIALPTREEFTKLFDPNASPALPGPEDAFPLVVDYGREFEAMVRAGHYDFVDERFHPENFLYARGSREYIIARAVPFEGIVFSEGVIYSLLRRKLAPATLPELLAFGASRPDEQRRHAVIALGTIFDNTLVPYLGGGPGNRDLGLEHFHGGWLGEACLFLAVSITT